MIKRNEISDKIVYKYIGTDEKIKYFCITKYLMIHRRKIKVERIQQPNFHEITFVYINPVKFYVRTHFTFPHHLLTPT